MNEVIVARTKSRGGICADYHSPVAQGDDAWKISEQGPTTSEGQGPGRWVDRSCAVAYPDPKGLL